LFPTRR